jgi:ubiquinone/menaquinone biosynthesis C-methylase UbiE
MMAQKSSSNEQADEDQTLKSQMEQMVASYDSYMSEVTFGKEHALRETTVNLAQMKPGDVVLEVGCGTGTLTLEAKRQAGPTGKVFGIDVIPGMIELSQRKAEQAQMDVSFQLGSIADIPFPINHFDVVLCSFMIFHMSEMTRHQGIAEVYRVLKPMGRLLVLDLALSPQTNAQEASGDLPQQDLRELLPLMEALGFSDVEIAPVVFPIQGISSLAFVRGSAGKN